MKLLTWIFRTAVMRKVRKLRKRKEAAITSSVPNERMALVIEQHEISSTFLCYSLQNAQLSDPYRLTLFRTSRGESRAYYGERLKDIFVRVIGLKRGVM